MAPKSQQKQEAPQGGVPLTGGEWRPWVEGEVVVGRFLRLRDGNKGGSLVDLELNDGQVVTAPAPKMLSDALDGVKPGTRVSIKLIGKKKSKTTGNEYAVFEARAFED